MATPVEMTEEIPPAARSAGESQDITLYGVQIEPETNPKKPPKPRPDPDEDLPEPIDIRALIYGFCFQGHCYRLATPVIYAFEGQPGFAPVGCGYEGKPDYRSWIITTEAKITRIERQKGTAGELILDFNLPGRSPVTLTYSAKVQIATKAGKVYE